MSLLIDACPLAHSSPQSEHVLGPVELSNLARVPLRNDAVCGFELAHPAARPTSHVPVVLSSTAPYVHLSAVQTTGRKSHTLRAGK